MDEDGDSCDECSAFYPECEECFGSEDVKKICQKFLNKKHSWIKEFRKRLEERLKLLRLWKKTAKTQKDKLCYGLMADEIDFALTEFNDLKKRKVKIKKVEKIKSRMILIRLFYRRLFRSSNQMGSRPILRLGRRSKFI